ncbi:hypothetical protein ACR3I8_19080 [Priestia flexa]
MLKNLFKRNITAAEFWSWFEKIVKHILSWMKTATKYCLIS